MTAIEDREHFRNTLKNLVPLNVLSESDLNEMARTLQPQIVSRGEFVFRQGDKAQENVYLLFGELQLLSDLRNLDTVVAGTETACLPVAQHFPRMMSARAGTDVTVLRVDSRQLNELIIHRVGSDYEVSDVSIDDGGDWMTRMLQSGIFQRIPAANIQLVIMRMEEMTYQQGTVIIQQGSEADFYYIIKQGKCEVLRVAEPGYDAVRLNELAVGDAFGEEGLVGDKPRSTTVRMLTDGVLLRLGKDDFTELLRKPILRPLNYAQAIDRVAAGALWLDVREREQYEQGHLEGSLNVPVALLRLQAKTLAPGQHYICCCEDGKKSAAASYLLTERGFDTYLLDGGLGAIDAGEPDPELAAAHVYAPLEREPSELPEPQSDSDPLRMLRDELAEMHSMRQSAERLASALRSQLNELRQSTEMALQAESDKLIELGLELEMTKDDLDEMRRQRDEALAKLGA